MADGTPRAGASVEGRHMMNDGHPMNDGIR